MPYNLTLPNEQQPIGFVMINGQRVPVMPDPEWVRALKKLLAAVNAG